MSSVGRTSKRGCLFLLKSQICDHCDQIAPVNRDYSIVSIMSRLWLVQKLRLSLAGQAPWSSFEGAWGGCRGTARELPGMIDKPAIDKPWLDVWPIAWLSGCLSGWLVGWVDGCSVIVWDHVCHLNPEIDDSAPQRIRYKVS